MILDWLLGKRDADPTDALYSAIVAAARQPRFYADWRVPDTIDGRFEMMCLHAFLVLERLRELGANDLAQSLTNRFFAEMDAALRQAGVGDLVVGKKVRKMAEAFYGRATAYRSGLERGGDALNDALVRNIYGSGHAGELASWTTQAAMALRKRDVSDFERGAIKFEQ